MEEIETALSPNSPAIPPFAEELLARGIESGLATRLANRFSGWPELKDAVLYPGGIDGVSSEELERVKSAGQRREISRRTVRRLVSECEFRCCLCWNLDSHMGVVIHHIRPHETAPDDNYDNLVVLCPNHHSLVHTTWQLTRHPYSPDVLRERKEAFVKAIKDFRAGQRPAPGREPPTVGRIVDRLSLSDTIREKLSEGQRRVALVGMLRQKLADAPHELLVLDAIFADTLDTTTDLLWLKFEALLGVNS